MSMRLYSLLIFICVLLSVPANAQRRDDLLFRSVCEELERMDRYWQAKQKLPAHTIRVDPVSGEEWIDFADGNGKRIKGKTGDAELVKVVYASSLPVFPLMDTLRITDTTGVLRVKPVYLNGHYFCVEGRNAHKGRHENSGSMYVSSQKGSGKYIYLSFTFAGNDDLFYCQFEMINGKPVLHQSKVVPHNATIERPAHLE